VQDLVWSYGRPGTTGAWELASEDAREGDADDMTSGRITLAPDTMGGAPAMRGLRIPVARVVGMVADGMSEDEMLKAYPELECEDIRDAPRYAAEAVREREIPLV
jgi:uncharacterized protein (DUF433 family)